MDFSDLMNIASSNQVNAVNKVKNKKSKDGSSQVSSEAVKAFLAKQNAEKAKQKEQEEAARRARIQARLQGKQLDKSKNNKKHEDSPNEAGDRKQRNHEKNQNPPPTQDSVTSSSKTHSKHNLTQGKNAERKILKPKEKEKLMKKPEDRTKPVEQKKTGAKVRKPAPPALSFQELMNVAKQQADNPDAFRNITAAHGPKIGGNIAEKSLSNDPSSEGKRKKEISRKDNISTGKDSREKNSNSQKKQNVKNHERKVPDTAKRKKPEGHDRKLSEIRKLPSNHEKNNCKKFPGKAEIDAKRKSSEKPKVMTIERHTISQRDYGMPMKYRGPTADFQRKRRHVPCDDDEDEYDEDMDEFIDDTEEAPETVSSYIKEIFGYDRNRFRDRCEDTSNMESSYGDIQKEEAKSLRIARLEDEVEKLKESYELQQMQQRKKKKLKR